jgi:hypothetical protein
LTKKRTCTIGLHGPWGESSSVFIRVYFTFPKDYPQAGHPDGTPVVELQDNPLIPVKDRAFILRKLRAIRERRRPCLEACLRFLLFADEDEHAGRPAVGSETSSDDDGRPVSRKSRDFTVALLRNNKNLAEPRTSQGTFGPNGMLAMYLTLPFSSFFVIRRTRLLFSSTSTDRTQCLARFVSFLSKTIAEFAAESRQWAALVSSTCVTL